MPDENVMRRLRYAKKMARDYLSEYYENIICYEDTEPIHLSCLVSPEKEVKIRICVDQVNDEDFSILEQLPVVNGVIKELWQKEYNKLSFFRYQKTDGLWQMVSWNCLFSPYKKTQKFQLNDCQQNDRGFIYFILNGKTNEVKIGRSCNPNRRLQELNSYYRYVLGNKPLQLLSIIETSEQRKLERKLHIKFNEFNVSGEWFEYSRELKNYIEEYSECPKRQ